MAATLLDHDPASVAEAVTALVDAGLLGGRGRFSRPGDRLVSQIEGIGEMAHGFTAPAGAPISPRRR